MLLVRCASLPDTLGVEDLRGTVRFPYDLLMTERHGPAYRWPCLSSDGRGEKRGGVYNRTTTPPMVMMAMKVFCISNFALLVAAFVFTMLLFLAWIFSAITILH